MVPLLGIPASPGYAIGPVHLVRRGKIVPERRTVTEAELPAETARFRDAVDRAQAEIQDLADSLARELGTDEADILASQLLILEDILIWDATLEVMGRDLVNAEAAFAAAVGDVVTGFLQIEDEVFRERVGDLRDVEQRVLRAFTGARDPGPAAPVTPSVVVAYDLAPSDTAALGRENVLGFLMDVGGTTSHVAILARSLGVPAVVGLGGRALALDQGTEVAVDGSAGEVVVRPDEATKERIHGLASTAAVTNEKLASLRDLPALTPDGHRVRLMANVEMLLEVDEALARGAEGVGLLRTEFFFFQHQRIPTEEEQVRAYTELVGRMEGRPVVFRTLDVGGDKVSDYLGAKREYNPFLGWRGIRFLLANRALFKSQVRAIFRAAAAGRAKLMFPMISGVQELREAREVCEEAADELEREGLDHDPGIEIGVMVETPSAVLVADLLAAECDFFSIGTNDLIQYMLAMDRGNSRVSYLYQPLHPGVLRAIDQTVKAAHAAGLWVGLCGEMGAETRLAEVLLGLGLDEISLHGPALPKIKQVIRWTNLSEARGVVETLLDMPTADAANTWLADYIAQRKRLRIEEGAT